MIATEKPPQAMSQFKTVNESMAFWL